MTQEVRARLRQGNVTWVAFTANKDLDARVRWSLFDRVQVWKERNENGQAVFYVRVAADAQCSIETILDSMIRVIGPLQKQYPSIAIERGINTIDIMIPTTDFYTVFRSGQAAIGRASFDV